MCGIAGITGREELEAAWQQESLRRMLAMIRHRGPDQCGIYQDRNAALGSVRLSIIDLQTGRQPIRNEDGTLWIVCNGEIFNYLELRPDLERRGHRFATNTDTEVILHLYEECGPACLHHLNGQFALAIWDAPRQRLFLARDRLGVRPLFYTQKNGLFLFASEMKALLAHPAVTAEMDPVTLDQIFRYWSPLAGRTIFRHIHEIPPGHFLAGAGGEMARKQYWDLSFPPEEETASRCGPSAAGEYLEQFKALLIDATLIRLRSDVPVGAYLSGGLDSSLVASIIASRTNSRLATFSISFDDSDFDESEFQTRMSRYLGARHEVVHATHADIVRVFPAVIWHAETPITRTAPAPMFLLSRLVRDSGFKVVLAGEGADEFLAGYDIFKEAAIRRFWARQPGSLLRPLLLRRLYRDIPALAGPGSSFLSAFFRWRLSDVDSPYYSHLVRWRNNARTRRFFSDDLMDAIARETSPHHLPELPPLFMTWGPLQRSQYLESTIFLSQYLLSSQGDRMAMAHSIESRHPFLDYRVVEFCNRLPSALKLHGLRDKRLLRLLGREFLPAGLWQRPKRPYRAPVHKSLLCQPAPGYVRELLSPENLKSSGLFKPAVVQQLIHKAARGLPLSETDDMALAGILSAQLVYQQFISGFPAAEPLSPGGAVAIRVASPPAKSEAHPAQEHSGNGLPL
jgi:asparagine synthase (glutamine-hydrolysing)